MGAHLPSPCQKAGSTTRSYRRCGPPHTRQEAANVQLFTTQGGGQVKRRRHDCVDPSEQPEESVRPSLPPSLPPLRHRLSGGVRTDAIGLNIWLSSLPLFATFRIKIVLRDSYFLAKKARVLTRLTAFVAEMNPPRLLSQQLPFKILLGGSNGPGGRPPRWVDRNTARWSTEKKRPFLMTFFFST